MILGVWAGAVPFDTHFPVSPPGIALYPGQAQLLSCRHHYEVIPPLRSPGQPGAVKCTTQRINYTDPFSNQTLVRHPWVWAACPVGPHPGALVFFLPVALPTSLALGPRRVVALAGLSALSLVRLALGTLYSAIRS